MKMLRARWALGAVLAAAVVLAGCVGNTESAENVTSTSATLVGYGTPSTSSTDYYFEYGTTTSYGQQTPVRHVDGLTPGSTYTIAENVASLTPNTTYYYALCGKERTDTEYLCGSTRSFITTTFTNPTHDTSGSETAVGDPKIVRADDYYWLSGSGCSLRRSTGAIAWTVLPDVCGGAAGMHPTTMEMNPDTTQALNVDFWGTEVAKIGSQWVIVTSGNRHYPSHNATYTRGAIWIGTATNPDGPYTWAPDATAQDSEAQLYDPSIFVDPNNGRTFLLYAHWTGSPDVTIVTQELDPSNITQLKSGTSPVTLLSTAVDPQARELANGKTGLKIVEGPGVFFTDGQYFLYYGAGAVAYDYQAIDGQPYTFNLATATTFPVSVSSSSRFLKYAAPVLSGGNGWRQPGHGAVFQDGDGTYWTAVSPYHDSGTQDRIVVLQKMTYRHDTKTFSIYNGVINAGAIGVPVP